MKRIFLRGGQWVYEWDLAGGEATGWHTHRLPHVSQCIVGKAVCEIENADGTITATPMGGPFDLLEVPVGARHQIRAVDGPARGLCWIPLLDRDNRLMTYFDMAAHLELYP